MWKIVIDAEHKPQPKIATALIQLAGKTKLRAVHKINVLLDGAVRDEFGAAAAGAEVRGHRALLVAQREQEVAALADVGHLADHIAGGRETDHFREEPLRPDDTCVQCRERNKLDGIIFLKRVCRECKMS